MHIPSSTSLGTRLLQISQGLELRTLKVRGLGHDQMTCWMRSLKEPCFDMLSMPGVFDRDLEYRRREIAHRLGRN